MRALLLVVAVIMVLIASSMAIPCSQGLPVIMGRTLAIGVENSSLFVRLVDPSDNTVSDAVSLQLSQAYVIERQRRIEEDRIKCSFTRNLFSWEPQSLNESKTDMVGYIDLSTFNCDASMDEVVHNGVNIKRIKMAYSSPRFTDKVEALFELPDNSTLKESYDKTNFTTNGRQYSSYYTKDVLKVSWSVVNHTWYDGQSDYGTFVILYNRISATTHAGTVSVHDDSEITLSWNSTDGKKGFIWSIEKTLIADGYPIDSGDIGNPKAEFPVQDGFELTVIQGVAPCQLLPWDTLLIDPTITALFVVDPISRSSGSRVPIAAIVAPVLAGVVLIVVIIIVLFVTVPSFRYIVSPYRKRVETHSVGGTQQPKGASAAEEPSNAWKPGQKSTSDQGL